MKVASAHSPGEVCLKPNFLHAYPKALFSAIISSVTRRFRAIKRRVLQSRLGLSGMVARTLKVCGSIETHEPVYLGHDCSIDVGIGGHLVFEGNNYI